VQYVNGLEGTNLLIMRENDVKIITDLMMGGSGQISGDSELSELHLSAISEAMNQMVGSAATSLSSMFEKRVDISPPESMLISFTGDRENIGFENNNQIVKVAFSLIVGNLIDSQIMQLLPVPFAKELVQNLLRAGEKEEPLIASEPQPAAREPQHAAPEPPRQRPQEKKTPEEYSKPGFAAQPQREQPHQSAYQQMPYMPPPPQNHQNPINVQPAQFQSFDSGIQPYEAQNISLLMDVPLQITVELGRTMKKIKEILEFGQGSIIELDKLAGEPVDILVNGKNVAKGEVVVIDESFGVRITDIIHPSKRL